MKKAVFRNKFWPVTVVVCLMLALSCSDALAWGGHEGGRGEGHHESYHYRGGRWYRPGWFGFDVAVSALTVGAIVASLPRGYTTVVVSGSPYYYYDGYYFNTCPYGYVVVPQPVVVQQPVVVTPAAPDNETVIINVPNSKGGYTPVRLFRRDNGYVGPQGEYYPGNPSIEQLKALYGK